MFRNILGLSLFALIISNGLCVASADGPLSRGVGERIANFTLPEVTTGDLVSLDDHRGDLATVIIFMGLDCPVGDLYMPRIVRMAERFRISGVNFIAINSNRGQGADEIAHQVGSFGIKFPVLKDEGNAVADQLLAERTCEVLVLDADLKLCYRGAIDDQYGLGLAKDEPTQNYLETTITCLQDGAEIETTGTSVIGCPIERVLVTASGSTSDLEKLMRLDLPERVNALIATADRVRAPSATIEEAWAEVAPNEDALIDEVGKVTYSADVASIIQQKCAQCHRSGEVGPFSLTTFEEVERRTTGIEEVVDLRRMPPWHADPRFGEFANDRSLTSLERATILAWIEQGAPEGDPADLPSPPNYPEGWIVGEPDLVIEMPEDYLVSPEGVEDYQRFRIPLNLDHDVWFRAGEARPGDREVVHHIIAYLIPPGSNRPDIEFGHLCAYAPGEMPTVYPEGTAKKIPAGSDIMLEVHYTPIGTVRKDRSKVGFVFSKEPIQRQAQTIGISNGRIRIPPETSDHEEFAHQIVHRDMKLLSLMPHMHLRGKSFRYTTTYADGTTETLLDVPAYDFAWQSYYYLKEPVSLQKGERLDCRAVYDNSSRNPVNPDPTATVRWGKQTWEEMMIGYIDVSYPLETTIDPSAFKVTVDSELE